MFSKNRAKTPTILQMEALECGAACLAIILAYYKRFVPLEELRFECGVSRDGANAYNIMQSAKGYGLESEGYRIEFKDLKDFPAPAMIHWKGCHFMVYEGMDDEKIYINDPASGPKSFTHEDFEKDFTNYIFTFKKTDKFKPGGEPPAVLPLLNERAKGSYKSLFYLFLCGIGLSIIGAVTPMFSRMFIDQVLVAKMTTVFFPLIMSLIVATLMQMAFSVLNQYYTKRFNHKLTVYYTSEFLWHIFNLPMRFFTQRWPSDISSRLELNSKISGLIAGIYVDIVVNLIMVCVFLSLMLYLDVQLTIISLSAIVVNAAVIKLTERLRKDNSQRVMAEQGRSSGLNYMGIQQIESFKAQGREQEAFSSMMSSNVRISNLNQYLTEKTAVYDIIPGIVSALITTSILTLGCYKVMISEMTIGTLFAYQFVSGSFQSPLSSLLGIPSQLHNMMGTFVKLNDILQYPFDKKVEILNYTPEEIEEEIENKITGKIELKNIKFGYAPLDDPLLEDFNLTIHPSEHVAIVGGSGSGKSTLARLLNDIYQPLSGTIEFDGIDLQKINRLVYVNSVSMVSQDIMIFDGSFRDNITMWDHTIALEDVIKAAKDACIHDFITSSHSGYDDILKEKGKNISGGQRQKIEIARALVANPNVLILDEATSALDSMTEYEILNNIRRRGCTAIIIAHRLSTIKDADKIIVMDHGKIVETGTHDGLIEKKGHYYKLMMAEEK